MVSILKLPFVTYKIIWNHFISTRHDTGYIHSVDSVIESSLRARDHREQKFCTD